MDLSKIIAISGYPGLFKVVAQAHNGIIVESLIDQRRMQAFSSYKISALDDISIFTTGDDVPLKEVLTKVFEKENGGESLGLKATNEELKAYMKVVLPDYDEARVHVSDIKKLVSWYALLLKNDLLKTTIEEKKVEEIEGEDKPKVKKAAAKSATVKAKGEAAKPKVTATKGARKTATVRKNGA